MIICVPVRLVSESNMREHWTKKIRRKKQQKELICLYLKNEIQTKMTPPVQITLTRIAPRKLDYDNLVSSMKTVQDAIAGFLLPDLAPGRADDPSQGLSFSYGQKRGSPKEYGLEIAINKLDGDL